MTTYLEIAQILVAAVLVVSILLQVKGTGLGGVFGTEGSVYRTRRGIEKTLFQLTIVLAVLFVLLSIVSVVVAV